MNPYTGLAILKKQSLALIILAVGLVGRILLSYLGHNFDFQSFWLVGEIAGKFQNVYVETDRYNYGPIWFSLLFIFRKVADFAPGSETSVFRWQIVLVLSLVDVGIFQLLRKKMSLKGAALYFLNPVVMLISGYHNQFDNFAILMAIGSSLLLDRFLTQGTIRSLFVGLILLGLSITTKHVFIFFPIWIAVKLISRRNWKIAGIGLCVPIGIFLISFLPFVSNGGLGEIIHNVFLYQSAGNGPFLRLVVPDIIKHISSPTIWLAGIMTLCGYLLRKFDFWKLSLVYLAVLVIFSPAIANQYLAIPTAFIACFPNPFLIIYSLWCSFIIVGNKDGLHLDTLQTFFSKTPSFIFYDIAIFTLLAGFIFFVIQQAQIYWSRRMASL
ncbi:MAG TPA: hypothetical protein PKO03_06955 [Anaerolineaceae bacterium]|nr:hypothetical protein [Anaerolineaceae bacterium]